MSTEGQAAAVQKSGWPSLFENIITLVLCTLMAAGLVGLTATWRSSTVQLIGVDRMHVIQSHWWGLSTKETRYRSTGTGWVIVRPNGDEVSMSNQPIELHD